MHVHGLSATTVPGLSISYLGFQTQMNLHFSFGELVCCVYCSTTFIKDVVLLLVLFPK